MKKLMFVLAMYYSLLLISCEVQPESQVTAPEIEKGEVALEIFSHSRRIEKITPLDESKHSGFITSELRSLLPALKNKRMRVKSNTNEPDTVFLLSEIPIYKEETSYSCIYTTGLMESENEDITPPDMNPIYKFTSTPLQPEMVIKKTTIKDGKITAYNANRDVLVSEPYADTNMKEFLDTLIHYVNLAETQESKAGVAPQRALVKSQLLNMKPPKGSKVTELSNGNILLEQELDDQTTATFTGKQMIPLKEGKLRSRTEITAQMDRTVRFELLQGTQLLERKRFFYSEREGLKNSAKIRGQALYNPEMIVNEFLEQSDDGLPVIRTIQEYYVTNKMVFHNLQNK